MLKNMIQTVSKMVLKKIQRIIYHMPHGKNKLKVVQKWSQNGPKMVTESSKWLKD